MMKPITKPIPPLVNNNRNLSIAVSTALSLKTETNSWQGGYMMSVKVENTTEKPVSSWSLTLKKEDFDISNIWGAEVKVSGDSVIITPVAYNKEIGANDSVSFGFVASGTAKTDFSYELK